MSKTNKNKGDSFTKFKSYNRDTKKTKLTLVCLTNFTKHDYKLPFIPRKGERIFVKYKLFKVQSVVYFNDTNEIEIRIV